MKKITYLFAAMVAALGFSACNETWDDNPTLATHEGDEVINFLNTPVEANTAILITTENNTGTLKLTGSQPTEYGYAATVAYQVEMALNEDFTTPAVEGTDVPTSYILGTFYDLSNINPTLRSVAEGMCKLLDVPNGGAEIPTGYKTVYMRLRANVVNENNQAVAGTSFTSNTIAYKQINCGYLAVITPGISRDPAIYLRGDVNGWLNDAFNGINAEILPTYELLTTTEADTYELDYVEIPAGGGFKIADKNWGDPNISTDAVVGTFGEWIPCVWNAGNSSFSEDFKGSIMVKGSDHNWQIMFTKAEPDTPGQASGIYIKGDFNGWADQAAFEFKTTDVKNTWKTDVISLPAGTFKVADAGWSNPNLGSNGEDIVPGSKYTCEFGAGNINLATAFQGTATLRLKNGKWILLLSPMAS